MKVLSCLVLLWLVLWSGFAWSADAYQEPECMTNVKKEEDINICQFATAKYFELRVQELEEKIMQHFTGVQLDRFKSAQSNWRAFMENDCAIQANFYEGAGVYTAIISQCLQTHYRERLEILEHYLCPEHNYLNGCANNQAQKDEH